MKHLLTTGATGMLGHFILHKWLRNNQPIAVVCRAKKHITAKARVEKAIRAIETHYQVHLPRPVVIEGNLHKNELGISVKDQAWIKRNCDSVLHNAASIKFHSDHDSDTAHQFEPYISNITGTQNLVDLCKKLSITNFFHVSTAYVCGKTEQLVDESFNATTFGNDYEQSKHDAEQIVLSAPHLNSKTILRPSIVVGDPQTGFAPAFHGVYTPLQLGFLFLNGIVKAGQTDLSPEEVHELVNKHFIKQLDLSGDESKNLIPATWVADSIFKVVNDQNLQNQKIHLTTPNPTSVADLLDSMKNVILNRLPEVKKTTTGVPSELMTLDGVKNMMGTYRTYLGTDPEFKSISESAECELEQCPELDDQSLNQLWEYAIDADFAPPHVDADLSFIDVSSLFAKIAANSTAAEFRKVNLTVDGSFGGNWLMEIETSSGFKILQVHQNKQDENATSIRINSCALWSVVNRDMTAQQALYAGQLFVRINDEDLDIDELCTGLFTAFQNLAAAPAPTDNLVSPTVMDHIIDEGMSV